MLIYDTMTLRTNSKIILRYMIFQDLCKNTLFSLETIRKTIHCIIMHVKVYFTYFT